MMILWGRDARVVYNDAFRPLAGDRHSLALGHPVATGWPELRSFYEKVMAATFEGRTASYQDRPHVIESSGRKEEYFLSLDFSPLRDEAGEIHGALAIVRDTTEQARTQQRLRVAQAIGGIGTFEWFPETGQMLVSDEFRKIWGLEANEPVTDTKLLQLLHPEDRERVIEYLRRYEEINPLDYTEYRRIDPLTGEVHWIARRGEEISSPNGSLRRFVGVSFDITARKQAERKMLEHESRWRNLFDQMQEGFFIGKAIRGDEGLMVDFRIDELNPAFARQIGIPFGEEVSASSILTDMGPAVIETLAHVLETGEAAEFEWPMPSMGNRWYEARAHRVDTERFAVLLLDVTSRKKAEQAILESEAKFRLLAQSMPNHVWTARANGKIDWMNERTYDYAGVPKGTLDSENWSSIAHPDDLPRIDESWASAVQHGHLFKGELRLRRRDGVYRWHIVRAVPVRNRMGDIKRWIGTNTDIDDQKSAETALADLAATLEQRVEARTAELLRTQDALRQSQKMEAIGNLTGGIAHDFNNLLQVISGNLHLIAKDMTGNPKLEERLQNAIKGVTRGAKLASQLLAFGRRQPLAPKIINVGRLIHNMDDILHRALGEAITVETIIEDNLWNTEIDPGNVENAILNLAINARDAMDDSGHVVIEVRNVLIDVYSMSHRMDLTAGQYVMIAVRDSGCGMSEEVMEKVFEPFFTTKPEGKGTGLGLSMVYGFVKQSGGHVIIESQQGEGTTIRMYLPRAAGGEDADGASDSATAPIKGGTETILVAEDDDAVLDTVVATLSDLGYRVLRAKDGPGALTVLESGAPVDLLFSDMIMPGSLKGDELVRRAREFQPGIGILFTSGYPDGSGAKMPEEPGIELLAKPYSREALARKIRSALDGRGQEKRGGTDVAAEPAEDAGKSAHVPIASGPMILLCEDDYLIRLTTAEILEDQGYTVLEAGSGSEALDLLKQYRVDVLMADFGLPDMTGVELANRAREMRPALPLLFATGHVQVENLPAGPTRQVTKPFTETLLLGALKELLRPAA
jgi:PAS domain S-box-containing protein